MALTAVLIFVILKIAVIDCIYDGLKARPHQYPYITLLNSPRFYCSGALISSKHILTAAHCHMSVRPGGSIKISMGAHQYFGNSVSDGEMVTSKKFWIHENFSMPTAVNDIGLVELETAILPSFLNRFIQIDTRHNADTYANDTRVIVAGWGLVSPGVIAKQLRFTTMNLIPMSECVKYKSHYIETLTENHICAVKVNNLPCE